MENLILSKESILAQFACFKETLSMQIPSEDMEGLMCHLQALVSLLSSSVEVQTSTEYLLNERKRHIINTETGIAKSVGATIFKEFLKGECSEEEAIHTMSERFNKALSLTIEAYRTIISAAKADKQLSKYAGQ